MVCRTACLGRPALAERIRASGLVSSLGNSLLVWGLTLLFSFPIGVGIAWTLARTRIPWSRTLEFIFWISYMVPALPTTIAWITLLDPDIGIINVALKNWFLLSRGHSTF